MFVVFFVALASTVARSPIFDQAVQFFDITSS